MTEPSAGLEMILPTDLVIRVKRTAVHENTTVVEAEIHVVANVPDETTGKNVAVSRRQHRGRLILLETAILIEDVGNQKRPVVGEIPTISDRGAPGVVPVQIHVLVAAGETEMQRIHHAPLSPGELHTEMMVVVDIPVETEGD